MATIQSWGLGRILAIVALIIVIILLVTGKMALVWEGVLFLLLIGAILL